MKLPQEAGKITIFNIKIMSAVSTFMGFCDSRVLDGTFDQTLYCNGKIRKLSTCIKLENKRPYNLRTANTFICSASYLMKFYVFYYVNKSRFDAINAVSCKNNRLNIQ